MTTAEERQRASDVVRSVLAAYERAGQRPPHDDEIVAAACEEDVGVSEMLARDALHEQRRDAANEVERLEAAYDEALRVYEKEQDAANAARKKMDDAYDAWQAALAEAGIAG